MKFLRSKWPWGVNALLIVFMVMLGLYLFNDTLGFANVFQAVFNYARTAAAEHEMPEIQWDWQIGMLCGIFVGAFCGALMNGSFKIVLGWEENKGLAGKTIKTVFGGVLSGFLIMLGAIVSGEVFFGQTAAAMELSAGAWIFLIAALAVGGITALFIERSRDNASDGEGK